VIDQGITEIRELIKDHVDRRIYYSASNPDGRLGTSIFDVHPEVLDYITKEIHSLYLE
jgi:hypothetical protein